MHLSWHSGREDHYTYEAPRETPTAPFSGAKPLAFEEVGLWAAGAMDEYTTVYIVVPPADGPRRIADCERKLHISPADYSIAIDDLPAAIRK